MRKIGTREMEGVTLYTIPEAASALGVRVQDVCRYIKDGTLWAQMIETLYLTSGRALKWFVMHQCIRQHYPPDCGISSSMHGWLISMIPENGDCIRCPHCSEVHYYPPKQPGRYIRSATPPIQCSSGFCRCGGWHIPDPKPDPIPCFDESCECPGYHIPAPDSKPLYEDEESDLPF